MNRAMRVLKIAVSATAFVFAVVRVAMMLIKLGGAVATIDGIANAIGYGDIVAPYEQWFDSWFILPLLTAVGVTPTPSA